MIPQRDKPAPPALGRYLLERRIASGGMADVYLALQTGSYGFVKRVALKVLKSEIAGDDENVKMFIREALVAAEFRHPNLAQVYEVGEVDGRLFIAMELVRGVSIAGLLKGLAQRSRGMPLNVALRIVIDALDGLSHAHEARGSDGRPLGLVHRDISPQNLMVGTDGTVKVVDFGIARAETIVGRTMSPKIKGKFSYMAPEQWEPRGGLDGRADLFALGVVLYEMTTGGTRLFRGETPKEIYRAVVVEPIPDPRARTPEYPEGLAKLVMRALERGPNARWPSARAMRAALLEYAQTQGWSLSSRAVADTVRAAIGPGEIESRWEIVPGAQPIGAPVTLEGAAGPSQPPPPMLIATSGAPEVDSSATTLPRHRGPVTAATVLEPGEPISPLVSDTLAPSQHHTLGIVTMPADLRARTRREMLLLALSSAAAALVVGVGLGFALGRGRESPSDPSVAPALAGGVSHTLRVAGALSLVGPGRGDALRALWVAGHPETDLRLKDLGAGEAIATLVAGGADLALVLREPTEAEQTAAHAHGFVLGASSRALIGRVPIALVVHPRNDVPALGFAQAQQLFRGEVPAWESLGGHAGGPVVLVLPPRNDEVLGPALSALLGAQPAGPGALLARTDAEARARVAGEIRAVTLLTQGGVDESNGALRAVAWASGASQLGAPVYALSRGPATGAVRAFVDWLRAPDLAPLLRASGVAR